MLAGLEGDSAPLDLGRFDRPNPVIGLFTPKAVSWPTLARVIRQPRGCSNIVYRQSAGMDPSRRVACHLYEPNNPLEQ